MTAPGRILPAPLPPAAQARPRDPSGRVLAPVRIEVRFTRGCVGYRHYCDSLAEAAGFLASPAFKQTAHIVKAVTITVVDPHAGPPPPGATEPRKWMPS